jgi:hypothetical protein
MKSPLPLLLLLLASGTGALAATPLEAARVEAAEARAVLDDLRRQQLALRGELGLLSGRIEAMKAPGGSVASRRSELDGALKQSQALSQTLTGLVQSASEAERRAGQAQGALVSALGEELVRLRQLFDATPDRARRGVLLGQMRAVRAEQENARLLLPPAELPLPMASPAGEADPEALLEQADALRDSEDRVRQRLRQLEGRLREAREERELQRRMDDFLGAEAMFDEQDRRLRVGASNPSAAPVFGPREGAPAAVQDPAPAQGGVQSPGTNDFPRTRTDAFGEHRPQVGRRPGTAAALEEAENLESLEALRRRLEEQARGLAREAESLERRARELK